LRVNYFLNLSVNYWSELHKWAWQHSGHSQDHVTLADSETYPSDADFMLARTTV